MRRAVAILLVRLARRLYEHDDRVVFLNVDLVPVAFGRPRAGEVRLFATNGYGSAVALRRDGYIPTGLGLPVPAALARLAGYRINEPWS